MNGNHNTANNEEWREICEKVLKEKKQDKVETLLEELARALDRRARGRDSGTGSSGSNS